MMQDIINEGEKYVMRTYGRFPIALDRGEGVYLYDVEGKKYLDMYAGIAVNALGYENPKLTKALEEQVHKCLHISNYYYNESQVATAKMLVENTHFSKVFFCNSGAEANEAALKLVKKYGKQHGKSQIIAMNKSFHGRTHGALTLTGQAKYQDSFMPLVPNVVYADYNDINSVKELFNENTAAVFLEVIQGEGGIIVGDVNFLQEVDKLCKENNALLVVDEVQTGIGRTGKLFGYQNFGIEPDVVTTAKGLAGGVPIGAMMCTEKCDVLVPGDHASTFGGNPLATAGSKVVLTELTTTNLLEQVQETGAYLTEKLNELKTEFPDMLTDVRGIGFMQGLEMTVPVLEVEKKCIEKGMLIVGAGTNVLRFVPPLVITKENVDECISILHEVFTEMKEV